MPTIINNKKVLYLSRISLPKSISVLFALCFTFLGISVFPAPTHASISYVQGNSTTTTILADPTSITCSLGSTVTQGDLIVGVAQIDSYNRTESLADSMGDAYTKLTLLNSNTALGFGQVVLWYSIASTTNASDTLTFTLNSGSTYENYMCAEYRGLNAVSPFDVATGTANTATSTSLASGFATTTFGGELLLGFGGGWQNHSATNTFTPGTGFTLRMQAATSTNNAKSFLEDELAGAAGSYQASATATSSTYYDTFMVAFSATSTTCTGNGSCYVIPGGTGVENGVDWNNAYPDLPSTLSCGTNYLLAGGVYDYTSTSTSKTWNANCTSGSPLNIYKAVPGGLGNPDQVAGWQSSYGTNQAVFSQTTDPDPEKSYNPFFNICGSYYTVDGIVPTSGTPSSSATYGIVFKTANDNSSFVNVGGASRCSSGNKNPTNVSLKHIEYNGVNPGYGFQVISGSRSSNVVTLTLATTTNWAVGDTFDLFNASTTDFNINLATTTSVTGSTITYAQSGSNETLVVASTTFVSLDPGTAGALGVTVATTTVSNFTASNSYFHDFSSNFINIGAGNTMSFSNDYFARDRSTSTQHAQAIQLENNNSNITISNDIFEDIKGTSIADPACGGNCSVNNLYFYNNLIFCTAAATGDINPASFPQCGVSSDISDDNGLNSVANAFVYGNTIANAEANINFLNASSSATVENNLFYDGSGAVAAIATGNGGSEDYNTSIGAIWSSFIMPSPGVHDYNEATGTNPFINSGDSAKNFALSSETVDPHLNDGVTLSSPYNLDLLGNLRGADSTWERGAYEFVTSTSAPTLATSSPTNVGTTSATLNASITADGGASSTIEGFYYGTTTSYGFVASSTGTFGVGSFSQTLSGLSPNTTYHYQAFAFNTAGTATTSDQTFTTSVSTSPPALAAPTFSGISTTSVTASSSITSSGGASSTVEGFNYGTTTSYGFVASTTGTFGLGNFTQSLGGLSCNTLYHVQAFAVNTSGAGTSSDATFTTSACTATTYTFTGPSSGNVSATSTNFSVTPNALYSGTITITPSGAGSTGLSPTVLTFSNSSTTQTFTITPTVSGSITLTPSNNGGLTNPSNLTYTSNATVPGSPTSVSAATSTPNQATVSFSAPASNGGSSILYYLASSTPGGFTATSTGSPITLTGLTNGTSYTFAVYAVNSVGTSSPSSASNSVSPIGLPGAPTSAVATAGNADASITFSAPASNGGSAITGYTVTSSPAGGTDTNAGSTTLTHILTGLTNGQSYTFTVTATNAIGTSASSTASNSVTPSTAPAVSTNSTTNIAQTTATLNGAIISTGGLNATQSGFAYGTDPTLTSGVSTTTLGAQTGTASFNQGITGLTANTTYYVRAYAVNSNGTTTGSVISFLTLPTVPTVTTQAPTANSGTVFTANGNITGTGGVNATTEGFVYGTTTGYGATTTSTGFFGTGAYTASISSLSCSTLYHVEAYAINSAGTSYGSDQTVTTQSCSAPTVTSQAASSITTTGATLNGTMSSDGNASSTLEGFTYGTTASYGATTTSSGTFGDSTFSQTLSGLSCATTYHYQALSSNYAGEGTSSDTTFTTSACVVSSGGGGGGGGGAVSFGGGGGGSVSASELASLLAPATTTTVTTPVSAPQTVSVLPAITEYLSPGMSGLQVTSLQRLLTTLGFFKGPVSGYFGPLTKQAVESYQASKGIPPIGSVGPLTRNSLNAQQPSVSISTASSTTPVSTIFTRNLTIGSTGNDVQALEHYLNTHGFVITWTGPGSPGEETTYFGSLTAAALTKFQKAHNLPATGYFGPMTRAVVNG